MKEDVNMNEISVDELAAFPSAIVIDVREPDEYGGGHVPGARNIPLGDVRDRSAEIDTTDAVYVICQSGRRSARACEVLVSAGVRAVNVIGGTSAWIESGRPVQS